ncbi:MAG: SDR family NAD(P)-dependent oxidoreductase [Myxococcota bacterium]
MSRELRFDGRVALVTGAGRGLGRSHARLLASRGAKVVVNDLGSSTSGGGRSSEAAAQVVDEIRADGGEAIVNTDSVEDGDRIVAAAMEAWGRLDIVINNAGILRDKAFHNLSVEDWDLVYRVHVLGAFRVTHAAWPILREQGYGRVIMTASSAGLYGNFGQANYAMAKLGLVGLSNTLALEGQRRGILCNVVAPFAKSQLTEGVIPEHVFDALDPEHVSPLVARLVHEGSEVTGGVFEVGGGYFSQLRWERSGGKAFRLGRPIRIEQIDRHWEDIARFDERSEHPANVIESMAPIVANIDAGPSRGGNDLIDVDTALAAELPELHSRYDERDLALYALGIGAAKDPTAPDALRYVYELHQDGMKAMPTYAVLPALNAVLSAAREGRSIPGLNYGFDRLLHGEQYTELTRPLPLSAELTQQIANTAHQDANELAKLFR